MEVLELFFEAKFQATIYINIITIYYNNYTLYNGILKKSLLRERGERNSPSSAPLLFFVFWVFGS
jgi:hypothetical protein